MNIRHSLSCKEERKLASELAAVLKEVYGNWLFHTQAAWKPRDAFDLVWFLDRLNCDAQFLEEVIEVIWSYNVDVSCFGNHVTAIMEHFQLDGTPVDYAIVFMRENMALVTLYLIQ